MLDSAAIGLGRSGRDAIPRVAMLEECHWRPSCLLVVGQRAVWLARRGWAAAVVVGLVVGMHAWRPRLEEVAESWALAGRTLMTAERDMEAVRPVETKANTCYRTWVLELEVSSAVALWGILGSSYACQQRMQLWQLVVLAEPARLVRVASTKLPLAAVVVRQAQEIWR